MVKSAQVDVMFPASPLFVLYAPDTLRRMLLPILAYANNETDVLYNLAWCVHWQVIFGFRSK